jgi:ABC-type lipoprotein release transport system permease subunit
LRSSANTSCLVAVLVPYLVGLGISRGVRQEAEDSVSFGADLYVSGNRFGRSVPIPLSSVEPISRIEGVRSVVPRIVGSISLGGEAGEAVLVGLPTDRFPQSISCIEGRLPSAGNRNELAIGTELALRLNIHLGDRLPPFYRNRNGERISHVVGLFRSDVSLWQARLIFTSFETAAAIFDQPGQATDLLVDCAPGYREEVQRAIARMVPSPSPQTENLLFRTVGRDELAAIVPRGLLHREGIFSALFVLAFAVAILALTVTSGLGNSERKREIGILKATGWQTDEILFRSAVESLSIAVVGFSVSLILAFVWLSWFNGYWIAGIFLAGVGPDPSFRVPYRLAPVPALLGFVISVAVVATGTLYSAWRAAIAPPIEAMRSGRG